MLWKRTNYWQINYYNVIFYQISNSLEKDINSTIADGYGKDKVKTEAIDVLQKVVGKLYRIKTILKPRCHLS